MISPLRVVWLFVFFDLKVETKKQRKEAASFRKNLLKDGFQMMQYSVYVRYCIDRYHAETHIRRLRMYVPLSGQVSILTVTDKQFGNIINVYGVKERKISEPKLLEFL